MNKVYKYVIEIDNIYSYESEFSLKNNNYIAKIIVSNNIKDYNNTVLKCDINKLKRKLIKDNNIIRYKKIEKNIISYPIKINKTNIDNFKFYAKEINNCINQFLENNKWKIKIS